MLLLILALIPHILAQDMPINVDRSRATHRGRNVQSIQQKIGYGLDGGTGPSMGGFKRKKLEFYTGETGVVWKLCEDWNAGNWKEENLNWTESVDRLFPLLTNDKLYNRFMAPGQFYATKTNVSIVMYIESISSFKAQTMDFDMDLYLAMSWYDRRLMHNCNHPILIQNKRTSEALWHPDLYFMNSKFAYFQTVTVPNFMMLVYLDGMIFKSLRVYVTLSCMLNLRSYPMDTQKCAFTIQSYAYVEDMINLTWYVNEAAGYPISHNPKISLNDMEIEEKNYDECSNPYPMFRGTGRWACLTGEIVMKRHITFHIIQTYIPTGMLVIISWLSFWLDPRAAPARIGLTITTLLTLTTMSNRARGELPQVAYVKAMDVWLSLCTTFVFSVLLEYTAVCFYFARKTTHCQHKRAAVEMMNTMWSMGQNLVNTWKAADVQILPQESEVTKPCQVCKCRWEKLGKIIDRTSRVAFPILFILATVIYWIFYKFTNFWDEEIE